MPARLIVALIATGNLRGIRESGNIFAAPTYFFLATSSLWPDTVVTSVPFHLER